MRLVLYVDDSEESAEARTLLARHGLAVDCRQWECEGACPTLLAGDLPDVIGYRGLPMIAVAVEALRRMGVH